MQKPNQNEYASFYETYVSKVGDVNLIDELEESRSLFEAVLTKVPIDKENYSYADGKWTLKQVVQHVIDAERAFSMRALRIGRGDSTPSPGFDEDVYANKATAENLSLSDLIDEFNSVRKSNIYLFKGMEESDHTNIGLANDVEFSTRALAAIIIGHQKHHQQTLLTHYLDSNYQHEEP